MPTLRELIESNTRVADAVLDQAAAINKLVPILDRLRQDVYKILNNNELERERVDLRLRDIDKHLGVIKDNADDIADDIKDVQRDITQPRIPLMPPDMLEERKPAMVRTIEALEKLKTSTKIFLLILIVIAAASGWLHLLIGGDK